MPCRHLKNSLFLTFVNQASKEKHTPRPNLLRSKVRGTRSPRAKASLRSFYHVTSRMFEVTAIAVKGNNSHFKYNRHL